MVERSEADLFSAIHAGDQAAFERAYALYQQRVRLIAWRVSHRPDWVDDLFNEAWCRAFSQRRTYDPSAPFPVWIAGIIQNVYREFCRREQKATGVQGADSPAAQVLAGRGVAEPERLAAEAEVLEGLNDCVNRLEPDDAKIIRLRFFQGLPLRGVAEEVGIPESTLREVRLPAAYQALRRCLGRKKIRFSEVFPAQVPDFGQYRGEEQA